MPDVSQKQLKVLIVEDQFLIAKQVEMILLSAGHAVVGTASNANDAQALAASMKPDLAFVDVSLADGATGADVGKFIVDQCGAAVVFTTANARRIPDDFCGAIGVVEKPFAKNDLLAALKFLAARLLDNPTDGIEDLPAKPQNLKLSPTFEARWAAA